MMQYLPPQKTKVAKRIATAIFVASMILFAVSGIRAIPYRSVLQFLSFALITVAILICVRYLFRSYCYRVEPCDDGFELVVLELSKGGAQTVCRLSMAALLSVEPYTKDVAKSKRAKIYNYCVDISPDDALLLSFSDSTYSASDTPICLKLQADGDFKDTLVSFLQK